eukprot:gene28796-18854_t
MPASAAAWTRSRHHTHINGAVCSSGVARRRTTEHSAGVAAAPAERRDRSEWSATLGLSGVALAA